MRFFCASEKRGFAITIDGSAGTGNEWAAVLASVNLPKTSNLRLQNVPSIARVAAGAFGFFDFDPRFSTDLFNCDSRHSSGFQFFQLCLGRSPSRGVASRGRSTQPRFPVARWSAPTNPPQPLVQRIRTRMYQASINATAVIATKAAISLAVTCRNVAMVKTGTVTMLRRSLVCGTAPGYWAGIMAVRSI